MSLKTYYKEKLNKMLFLEIKKEKFTKTFNLKVVEDVYLPVKSNTIIDRVKERDKLTDIPISMFIEGIYFVLGADENFKYNELYVKLLEKLENSSVIIKSKIAEYIKQENYEEAFILLKGLCFIEKTNEIYEKLLMICETLRQNNNEYKEEEYIIIKNAKEIQNFALPYLYEAFLKKEEKLYEEALFSLNTYLSKGGEETLEITDLKHSLKQINLYEKGKDILYENPKEALKIFISLLDEHADNPALYYYIGVSYRILENYEKAIYYLNEALTIDSDMVQVVNELGINYAAIGDFKTAVEYLRKAFKTTESIEICTNLVMCYLNLGDMERAKTHLDIAKNIDKEDEIVKELEQLVK